MQVAESVGYLKGPPALYRQGLKCKAFPPFLLPQDGMSNSLS